MPTFGNNNIVTNSGFTPNREMPDGGIPLHKATGPDIMASTFEKYGGLEIVPGGNLPPDKFVVSLHDSTKKCDRRFAFPTREQIDDACVGYCMMSGSPISPDIVAWPAMPA